MLLLDAIVAIVAIGCATWVAQLLVAKLGEGGRVRQRLLEERLSHVQLENEQLRQELAWHKQLIEAREQPGAEAGTRGGG